MTSNPESQIYKSEELLSRTISFLRFPMIVAVVLIHNQFATSVFDQFPGKEFPLYSNISFVVSQLLTKPIVPLFFLISGFLFFYRTEQFSTKIYRNKLHKRIHTLLIPYLLWNTLILILSIIRQKYFSGMGESNIGLADFGLMDCLRSYWGTGTGASSRPIAFQFWFIRDLMVVTLMTPLIHFLIRKGGLWFIAALGCLWFFDFWFDVTGFSIISIFFFSAGAWFSINKKNPVSLLSGRWIPYALLYVIVLVAAYLLRGQDIFQYADHLNILVGMMVIVSLTSRQLARDAWTPCSFLTRSSFFIFAYHGLTINWTLKFACMLLQPHTDGGFLAIYLIAPLLVIGLGLIAYALLERYFPRLTALLTGNRSH